ncbi:MAG: hypothetical protein IPG47_15790 [Thermoflexaceae bacterium]|nr:hypothetical protein [Thermoflexaceae bacterium]
MPRGKSTPQSGLYRDLSLIRRRWWVFIPFLLLGVVLAFSFGRVAGDANATASMQMETQIPAVFSGGDRGFRIFEAQAMTGDERFKALVREKLGDPNFDYSRYSIALSPISVADGVSRGVLALSVTDVDKANAERYRDAFVAAFTEAYTQPDGLFRLRFLESQEKVARNAEKNFQEAAAALRVEAAKRGVPVDEILRSRQYVNGGLPQELNRTEADAQFELSQVTAALAGNPSGAAASAILGTPVSDAQARAVLTERQATLQAAIDGIRKQRLAISDISIEDSAFLYLIDDLRSQTVIKDQAFNYLNNARATIANAQTTVDTSVSFSGGVAGTGMGRVAVAIAVTLVFGLISIYLLEWLLQIRENAPAGDPAR